MDYDTNGATYFGSTNVYGGTGYEKIVLSSDILEAIKAELGFYKQPLQKCGHCGQWGAVFCECVRCGAPIDPKE